LLAAQSAWPPEMLALGNNADTALLAANTTRMLIAGTADVFIIPYFHMWLATYVWPCPDQTAARLSERQEEWLRSLSGFFCPPERRAQLQPVVRTLRDLPYLDVSESPLFAAIRLRPEFSGRENRPALQNAIMSGIKYPIELGADAKSMEDQYVLDDGWYAVEKDFVWSRAAAMLMLPVPEECESQGCDAVLKFQVFGASPKRSVSVIFKNADQEWQWNEKIVARSTDFIEAKVPLGGKGGLRKLSISIPDATSPQMTGGSTDPRILGIALYRIDLINNFSQQ